MTLRPYRCTVKDQANIDAQIKLLLENEIISLSTSFYFFPVVMVDKKDEGAKKRMCINYIKLNENTLTEHFPMPCIEEMQDLFLGAYWFTTVDIANGFYHIEIAEEDQGKTANEPIRASF